MTLPTSRSEGERLEDLVKQGDQLMASLRQQAVNWHAQMLAGPVNAEVLETIQDFMVSNLPRLQDMTRKTGFDDEYARNIGPYKIIDNSAINTGTNRLTGLDPHTFAVDDQVVFRLIDGTMPGGISEDTQYWVRLAPVDNIQLSATKGGAALDITATGTGRSELLFNVNPVWGAITNPTTGFINAIQVELEAMDKVDASGWHQARKVDKTQTDGFLHNTYSTAETATLRTKLQDLIDGIRAPA